MKVKDVFILEEAVADLNEGKAFYDVQQKGSLYHLLRHHRKYGLCCRYLADAQRSGMDFQTN